VFDGFLQRGDRTKINRLGPNVLTEILTTSAPNRFAVLNDNPVKSLEALVLARFPDPAAFKPETYSDYCDYLGQLSKVCGFADLSD
jgi:hypothetical protein